MSLDGTGYKFEDEKYSSQSRKLKVGQTVRRRPRLQRVWSQKRVGLGWEIGTDLHLVQVRGHRPIWSGNWDWSSPTTSPRSQADLVRKFLWLIFNYKRSQADRVQKLRLIFSYYKSEVSADLVRKFVWLIYNYKRSQADRVRKLGLIFTYYKSEVSGQLGPDICLTDFQLQKVSGQSGSEIGTDLHLLQVRGCRSIMSGNWDWSSLTTSPRSQVDWVWKFGLDQLPKETVSIS